jgi:hypothetical protein
VEFEVFLEIGVAEVALRVSSQSKLKNMMRITSKVDLEPCLGRPLTYLVVDIDYRIIA